MRLGALGHGALNGPAIEADQRVGPGRPEQHQQVFVQERPGPQVGQVQRSGSVEVGRFDQPCHTVTTEENRKLLSVGGGDLHRVVNRGRFGLGPDHHQPTLRTGLLHDRQGAGGHRVMLVRVQVRHQRFELVEENAKLSAGAAGRRIGLIRLQRRVAVGFGADVPALAIGQSAGLKSEVGASDQRLEVEHRSGGRDFGQVPQERRSADRLGIGLGPDASNRPGNPHHQPRRVALNGAKLTAVGKEVFGTRPGFDHPFDRLPEVVSVDQGNSATAFVGETCYLRQVSFGLLVVLAEPFVLDLHQHDRPAGRLGDLQVLDLPHDRVDPSGGGLNVLGRVLSKFRLLAQQPRGNAAGIEAAADVGPGPEDAAQTGLGHLFDEPVQVQFLFESKGARLRFMQVPRHRGFNAVEAGAGRRVQQFGPVVRRRLRVVKGAADQPDPPSVDNEALSVVANPGHTYPASTIRAIEDMGRDGV